MLAVALTIPAIDPLAVIVAMPNSDDVARFSTTPVLVMVATPISELVARFSTIADDVTVATPVSDDAPNLFT